MLFVGILIEFFLKKQVIRILSYDTAAGIMYYEVLRDIREEKRNAKGNSDDEEQSDLNWFAKQLMGDGYNVREALINSVHTVKQIC